MRSYVPNTHTTLLSTPTKLRICTNCDSKNVLTGLAGDPVEGAGSAGHGHCAAHCRQCDMRLSQVYTFSLPAEKSCPGSVMTHNAKVRAPSLWVDGKAGICDSCYANGRGNYRWDKTKAAQAARFAWLHKACTTEDGRHDAARILANAIRKVTRITKRFRIHESGDFFSPYYVDVWTDVATLLPDVTFWAPTRTWHMAETRPLWMAALTKFCQLSNVVCRPSALQFDMPAPVVDYMAAGTTAHMHAHSPNGEYECPASAGAHNCGPCTTCWDRPSVPVSYTAHTLDKGMREKN